MRSKHAQHVGATAIVRVRTIEHEGRLLGKATGAPIACFWIALFEAQRRMADRRVPAEIVGPAGTLFLPRPLTDEEICGLIDREFEGRSAQNKPSKVSEVRSQFNSGSLRPQKGKKPATPTPRFTRGEAVLSTSSAGLPSRVSSRASEHDLEELRRDVDLDQAFDTSVMFDARRRMLASIIFRQGQGKFRESLLTAYGGRCAVTGADAVAALEAAHIVPYSGPESSIAANGLLLRADIHTLFDLFLLTINPDGYRVMLSRSLRNSQYASLHGRKITIPPSEQDCPNRQALQTHCADFDELEEFRS